MRNVQKAISQGDTKLSNKRQVSFQERMLAGAVVKLSRFSVRCLPSLLKFTVLCIDNLMLSLSLFSKWYTSVFLFTGRSPRRSAAVSNPGNSEVPSNREAVSTEDNVETSSGKEACEAEQSDAVPGWNILLWKIHETEPRETWLLPNLASRQVNLFVRDQTSVMHRTCVLDRSELIE